MKYCLGRADWKDLKQGESHCFLLGNGLGGYCSQTVIGSNARHDHNLMVAAVVAPSKRMAMVRRVDEVLCVDGRRYDLASQAYVTEAWNQEGYRYLNRFTLDGLPVWEFMADGVRIEKRLVFVHGTNSLGLKYTIKANKGQQAWLEVTPVYGFHGKNDRPVDSYGICSGKEADRIVLEGNGVTLYLRTDGALKEISGESVRWYSYAQDSVDGRDGWGGGKKLHRIISPRTDPERRVQLNLLFAMDEEWLEGCFEDTASPGNEAVSAAERNPGTMEAVLDHLLKQELARQQEIAERSRRKSSLAKQLAVSAHSFLTRRDSTGGMSIMAGFPFFADWGRDTMIAFYGCTLAIGEQEAAKSILRTFMRYCRRGIMPNLFPEGGEEVLYNTVDASLLFINALWDYLKRYPDEEFAAEGLPVAESIVCWYGKGTDYNIHMDQDGLLEAGSGLWQLTWMDVRFEDILPTPRHGKPVEINAYWYNAVCIVSELLKTAGAGNKTLKQEKTVFQEKEKSPELVIGWSSMTSAEKAACLERLAEKIRGSFLEKFTKPDGTLYDVLVPEGEPGRAAKQVRCNEVFALTMPFTMIDKEQAEIILSQIRRELYTPVGLRSLSLKDPEFHPSYGGKQFDRDMAYHQGTVWAYPLGAYYRACLRFAENKKEAAEDILGQLEAIEAAMAEGCLGQLPEVYDGEYPAASKGCFAQAWSVAELLRACEEAEDVL